MKGRAAMSQIHRARLALAVVTTSFTIFICESGQTQDNVPVECALRVTTFDEYKGEQSGTATYLTVGQAEKTQHFILTAYHVLYQKTDVKLSLRGQKEIQLNGPEPLVEDDFCFDPYADLAVFRLSKGGISEFERLVRSGQLKAITLYNNGLGDPPIGAAANAVGNPFGVPAGPLTFRPVNIVYSTTISEYEKPTSRLDQVIEAKQVDAYIQYEDGHPNNGRFLLLETFSIKEGFSGGPVIDAATHKLLGIVLGGTPNLQTGRVAWACPAATISRVIGTFDHTSNLSKATKDSFKKLTHSPKNWPDSPFRRKTGSAYAQEDTYVLDGGETPRLIPPDVLRVAATKAEDGTKVIFRSWRFPYGAFANTRFTNTIFEDCQFDALSFDRAVLLGVTFINCNVLFEPASTTASPVDSARLVHGQPLLTCGIRMITRESKVKTLLLEAPAQEFERTLSRSQLSEISAPKFARSNTMANPVEPKPATANTTLKKEVAPRLPTAPAPVILPNPFNR